LPRHFRDAAAIVNESLLSPPDKPIAVGYWVQHNILRMWREAAPTSVR